MPKMPSEGKSSLRDFPSKAFIKHSRFVFSSVRPIAVAAGLIWVGRQLIKVLTSPSPSYLLDTLYEYQALFSKYWWLMMSAIVVIAWILRKQRRTARRPVYLVDFVCYKPPEPYKVTRQQCKLFTERSKLFDKDSLDFQAKIAEKAGLGDETYLPPIFFLYAQRESELQPSIQFARDEAEVVMFGAVKDLLDKTGLKPKEIDILVVNCSLFNPTPSLTSMIVNHFKLRSDVITYNLSGMGCSAGVIAIGLARDLLQVYKERNAVVVSTENITQNWYLGKDRSMLIPNLLFRMGSSAVLLSNKKSERDRAKYELLHVVRVHMGSDSKSYNCVFQHADDNGVLGVNLNKDIVSVASKALQKNLTKMGPIVLPWSEFAFLGINIFAAKILRMKVKAYIPDFKTSFNHFCLHAGGRSVIEGLSKQLELPADKSKPSFATLEWYGNTSSSTVWYSLGYIESCQQVRKGDVVWQVGFGSGFKCNSSVWRARRDVHVTHTAWRHLVKDKEEKPFSYVDVPST